MVDILNFETTSQQALSTSFDETYKEFSLKLDKNTNVIAFKISNFSLLYNTICFKYEAVTTRKC